MQKDNTVYIRNRVIELLEMHPAFLPLCDALKSGGIQVVHGIAEGLEEFLLKALERKLGYAFLNTFEEGNTLKGIYIEKSNQVLSPGTVIRMLGELGYTRNEKVSEEGDFSVKGGIIDIFSNEYVARLDYFGQVLEKISMIDPLTGAVEYNADLAYIPVALKKVSISSFDLPLLPTSLISFAPLEKGIIHKFDFEPLPFVFNNDRLLGFELGKRKNGIIIVATHNDEIIDRMRPLTDGSVFEYYNEKFSTGFTSDTLNISLFTDKELAGKLTLNIQRKKKQQNLLLINEIDLGDLVVHEDHGVAYYRGVLKKEVLGIIREYLYLEYAKGDKLYVPLEQLAKITKYIGAHGEKAPLTRLGTAEWEKSKEKVRKSVHDIASDLLKLYALREVAEKKPLDRETLHYQEVEDSFGFEMTPDQKTSIDEVMRDLASTRPMDRLIVGDVGYGKTEVAVRAAFKVVENNMQVAVLAPTTILADQLLDVFRSRLAKYGIRIGGLSRFQGDIKNAQTVEQVKKGELDIVVGTHRILQKDVVFKHLGLMIIDEEQRFGVEQKERLKGIRIDTNALSMSATPIPRTLHMALSGAKDISIINTPPKGRIPTKTQIIQRDWDTLAEIITDEVKKAGQVYFVHNRVATIGSIKGRLEKMLPDVRFVVAHGQMQSHFLSQIIEDFRLEEYDVLIASTIIENGIDIPNVNTIIINNAQNFGLSQLYQLRGRVGRSDAQSYCYLVYPESYELEGPARQRLYAIMNARDLGAGFTIAVKDLEIRGAGNFLGREQHGSISAVGFELFTRLLSTEITKLKGEL